MSTTRRSGADERSQRELLGTAADQGGAPLGERHGVVIPCLPLGPAERRQRSADVSCRKSALPAAQGAPAAAKRDRGQQMKEGVGRLTSATPKRSACPA